MRAGSALMMLFLPYHYSCQYPMLPATGSQARLLGFCPRMFSSLQGIKFYSTRTWKAFAPSVAQQICTLFLTANGFAEPISALDKLKYVGATSHLFVINQTCLFKEEMWPRSCGKRDTPGCSEGD